MDTWGAREEVTRPLMLVQVKCSLLVCLFLKLCCLVIACLDLTTPIHPNPPRPTRLGAHDTLHHLTSAPTKELDYQSGS